MGRGIRFTVALSLCALAVALLAVAAAARKSHKRHPKPAPAARIIRGPYLQQPTSTSVIVVWQTDRSTGGAVQYGSSSLTSSKGGGRGTFHTVKLKGLTPNSKYKYRVTNGGARTGLATFQTAPSSSEPFSFGVIGDYGIGSGAEYKNAQLMGGEGLRFTLTVGDNIYGNGYESEYDRGLFKPFGSFMRGAAFWPTLGNHDFGNDNGNGIQRNNAAAYFHNFVLPKRPADERYYTFKYGNAQFWSMSTENADYHPGSDQYNWLQQSLANSTACWKVAYTHNPPYSSTASRVNLRSTVVPLFEKYGVQIVFSGDQHQYERTVPLIASKKDEQLGITYVVTGGGGAKLKPFPDDFPPAYSFFRESIFEHMLVAVDGTNMNVRAIGTSGHTQDEFNLTCGKANSGGTPATG